MAFSQSAGFNDLVLRSMNNLHLFSGNNASEITIKTNNNVGIGTNDPLPNKLYVNGDTKITGIITCPAIELQSSTTALYVSTASTKSIFAGSTDVGTWNLFF
jgi:hypothetical protein